jgi:glycosyltransferase involved in cell wall biosynthesis
MKILIATGIFPPDIGGPATYLPQLIQLLKNDNHQITVVTFSDYADIEQEGKILKIIRLRRKENKIIKTFKYFWVLVKRLRQADLVYLNDITSSGLAFLLANFFRRKKFAVRVAGESVWEQAYQKGQTTSDCLAWQKEPLSFGLKFKKAVAVKICKKAGAIIVPSNFLKEIIKGWGIKEGKITVLYNAVDYSIFKKSAGKAGKSDWAKEILKQKDQDKRIFFSCGRLIKLKNFDYLIKTFAKAKAGFLYIIGEGPEENNLKDLIDNLNLADKVKLIPKVERKDLIGLLDKAEALILLSEVETFSFVALEALASGTRLILSAGGALKEIFGAWAGQGAEFIDLKDDQKLIDLLNNIELTKKIDQAGLVKLQEKYNLEKHYQSLVNIFNHL